MKRVADIVVEYLRDIGVTQVFMVSGGGIMHLVDALGQCAGIDYICNNNEAACAIAAEAYARVSGKIGAVLVTSGPGSTNALSAIPGAFVDSVPVIVISGQVRTDLIADYSKQRQNGPQEINILDMVKPVTKYSTLVSDPNQILVELAKAHAAAISDRPGPVWIAIPLDVQGANVDEQQLARFGSLGSASAPIAPSSADVAQVVAALHAAKRPLIIAGSGIRLAGAQDAFLRLCEILQMPVALTIGAMDVIPGDHDTFVGAFGPVGRRSANFAIQNADLLLSIGASMSISAIGFAKDFAPKARRIMVNVDEGELGKPNYVPDLAIRADARAFIEMLFPAFGASPPKVDPKWLEATRTWQTRYPAVEQVHYSDPDYVNTYRFVELLSGIAGPTDIVLTGNSLDAVSIYQVFKSRAGQRVFTNVNYGSMGWDLPAAVGAACADRSRRIILFTGDGSIQFNLQELMTIAVNRLDVKTFVINNLGYQSIRTTQTAYFESRYVGADFASGIGNPDFRLLAGAFGLSYYKADRQAEVQKVLNDMFAAKGPALCELRVSPRQARSPRVSSARDSNGVLVTQPLHNMFPFLEPAEVEENMHLFDDSEEKHPMPSGKHV